MLLSKGIKIGIYGISSTNDSLLSWAELVKVKIEGVVLPKARV
ncbi:MAG: hypothetical protein ACW986_07330 [Promethearchaeota archaeon]